MVKKNDYVLNPNSQRMVKVGGKVWRSLVKEGLLEGAYEAPDENILYDIEEVENIDELRNDFDEKLTPDIQAVRGRGKYKNKLVKRRKQISPEKMTEYTRNTAIQAVKENMDTLAGYSDDEELERELERIINEELLTGQTLKKVKQRKEKNNKKARFVEVESESLSEDEDDDDEYEDEESE
jgi:RecG-like helicase